MTIPAKISPSIIAAHLGCTPRYVRMVLNGERQVDTPLAKKIQEAHERLHAATYQALAHVER